MSDNEVKMYEELLELLEKKFESGEIDKGNYSELKERYQGKLEQSKLEARRNGSVPHIKVSGAQLSSDTVLSTAGSAKISGGDIPKDIKFAGSAKIENDLVCKSLKAAGSLRSGGSITAHEDVKCSGSFSCAGFLQAGGNVKFSGSAKVGGEVIVEGKIKGSGSFKCGDNLQADQGVSFSGSSVTKGNLLSQGTVEANGRMVVEGNLVGADVFINKNVLGHKLRRIKRSSIEGTVFAIDEVDISNTVVEQDVKGKNVIIGALSEVKGIVYYVNKIDIHKKAKLANEPVQIQEDQLKL